MKTRWNLAVCVVVLVVAATGPAIGNQDQVAGITVGSEAGVKVAGDPTPPTCGAIGDPGFLLGQNPNSPVDPDWDIMSSHQTSWGTFVMAESINQTAADPDWFNISSLTVWGLSLINVPTEAIQACDPTGMTFDVIFYEDTAGVPGAVICDLQSVTPAITNTLVQYIGFDLFQFDLPAACDLGTVGPKWVTIQSELYPDDCGFVWLSSADDGSGSLQDGGGGWQFKENDRSMCINGATIPVELVAFSTE